jgi:hypothetical protein
VVEGRAERRAERPEAERELFFFLKDRERGRKEEGG